jgi:lambda repressor-like predicted transcriptional regulator
MVLSMAPRQTSAGKPDPVLKPGAIGAALYVRGMSLQTAATRAGFSKTSLIRAKNGIHDLQWDKLAALAAVLGMHPADLLREPYATAAREHMPDKGRQTRAHTP